MAELTERELSAVRALNPEYRAFFFRNHAQDGVYILVNAEGPYLIEDTEPDEEGRLSTVLPVWCDARLAEGYAQLVPDLGLRAQRIEAGAFGREWVPMLREQGALLGLMPLSPEDEMEVDDPTPF
ncbi:MAG: DUF2750 domain-containing protein [Succinivibrionaceae bacterium]|nr:DUF2750 domain-containing protein [Succinivibrionaceae bacterium]